MTKTAAFLLSAGLGIAFMNDTFLLISFLFRRRGRNVSPIVFPFLSLIFIPLGLALGARPIGLGLAALLGDGGNWAFAKIIYDEWPTSRWTRFAVLKGIEGNHEVRLSLHRTNKFVLVERWHLAKGETGSVGLSRTGAFVETAEGYALEITPDHRIEVHRVGNEFRLADPKGKLDGFRFAP